MKAFQLTLVKNINSLIDLLGIYSKKDGWIVESQNHVFVGNPNGLNGTGFAVKSPLSCSKAVVFCSQHDAEMYGADYYLVDGHNNPLQMNIVKASEFFDREVNKAKELLVFISKEL